MLPVSLVVTVFIHLINIPYHVSLRRVSCMAAVRMCLPLMLPVAMVIPNKDRKCQLLNQHPCISSPMSLYTKYTFCFAF